MNDNAVIPALLVSILTLTGCGEKDIDDVDDISDIDITVTLKYVIEKEAGVEVPTKQLAFIITLKDSEAKNGFGYSNTGVEVSESSKFLLTVNDQVIDLVDYKNRSEEIFGEFTYQVDIDNVTDVTTPIVISLEHTETINFAFELPELLTIDSNVGSVFYPASDNATFSWNIDNMDTVAFYRNTSNDVAVDCGAIKNEITDGITSYTLTAGTLCKKNDFGRFKLMSSIIKPEVITNDFHSKDYDFIDPVKFYQYYQQFVIIE